MLGGTGAASVGQAGHTQEDLPWKGLEVPRDEKQGRGEEGRQGYS